MTRRESTHEEAPEEAPSAEPGRLGRYRGAAFVAVVLLLIGAVRIRTSNFPLERDEGEYAYAGQLILQGIPPYQLACNMKFPGTYAAYAVVMAVFGQNPAGIHLGLMLMTSLTSLLLYRLGRRLAGEGAGVVAATTCAFLSASPSLCGLAAHATHFAALFATAGLSLLWLARDTGAAGQVAAAGMMFGAAVLMKQQAAVLCLWGWAVVAVASLRGSNEPWPGRLRPPALYAAGAMLPRPSRARSSGMREASGPFGSGRSPMPERTSPRSASRPRRSNCCSVSPTSSKATRFCGCSAPPGYACSGSIDDSSP